MCLKLSPQNKKWLTQCLYYEFHNKPLCPTIVWENVALTVQRLKDKPNISLNLQWDTQSSQWKAYEKTVIQVLKNQVRDRTQGSSRFHYQSYFPSWARGIYPNVKIGPYFFYS